MAVGNVAQSFRLPSQFASMMPYLITVIGLVVIGFRNKNKKVKTKPVIHEGVSE